MFQRLLVTLSFVLFAAPIAGASPLHASDPDYRGAFTLLAVGSTSGASARYSTQIVMTNLSNHEVHIRVELYSTTGYREGILVNTLPPQSGTGAGSFWGGAQHNWEFDQTIGTEGMGALRVVAVKGDGSEDPTAVLHGYARIWMEPYAGGRMSAYVPGLTDYEASGSYRKTLVHPPDNDWVPYIIDPKPFARNLKDTSYGGARLNVGVVNFDRDRDATFAIGSRTGKDFWGGTYSADPISITVPAGSMRQVAVPLVYYVGPGAPPEFIYDTPLTTQVFVLGHTNDSGPWASFATLIDGATGASTFYLDTVTDSH